MKIKTKFIVVGIIALILILISGETIRVSQVQKDEAYLINLAGRQRMLSQKMTKEFLQYQKQPSEVNAAALMKTVKVFDQTLAAFIGGGSTSLELDPDSSRRQQIVAISNPEQVAQLRKIKKLWTEFSGAINDFIDNPNEAAADFVAKNNMALLKESNIAVSIFQRHASEQSGRNQQMQIIATVLTAGLIIWLFVTVLRLLNHISKLSERLNVNGTCLDASCRELSESSQSVADSASEQANSLHEISSALEQISSICESNNSSSEFTKSLTTEASDLTEQGLADMSSLNQAVATGKTSTQEMNEAMQNIQEAGSSISTVIKTIDQIAFQTNILALNAAVEAARAGEAGAGFAVVADEVRQLAHRSSSAAKETTDLIGTSIERSAVGVKACELVGLNLEKISEYAAQAGERLNVIAQKSSDIDQSADEILNAGKEQLSGIKQLDSAVVSLNESTTGNAATAEETASVSMQISEQSSELKESVDILQQLATTGKVKLHDVGSTQAESPAHSHEEASEDSAPKMLEFK